ncbi:spermidine synthase [Bdellovibrio sp. HCB209]|uniref:spermidine synthase n=1 Tax=Bdellovibrio sp. HCB209 TaxID=3394354 RepID=UPI0039B4A881
MDHRKLKLLSFALSFCGFAYQSLMAKTFAVFLQEEIIGFCLSSALFIYGIGLGSRKSSKAKDPLSSLINVELMLMALGAVAPMVVTYLFFVPSLELVEFFGTKLPAGPLMMIFVLLAGTLSLSLGFLTGFETPLLFRLRAEENNQSHLNQILAFSYFGALGASIVVPLILIPRLEVYGSAILIALLSGGICLYLSVQSESTKRLQRITTSAFVFVIVFAFIQSPLQQLSLRIRYYGEYPKSVSQWSDIRDYASEINKSIKVTRHLSHYQAIDLVDGRDEKGPFFSLWLNGQFQFDSRYEKSYHDAFLTGAMNLTKSTPKKILILGAGDGLLLRDALKRFPNDTEITLVELDPMVLELAKTDRRWRDLSENSLTNPRAEIITDDAFHFLRGSKRTWDAVFLDFPYPYSVELSKLYSLEFYSIVKNRLSPEGFIVFDFPTNESAAVINSTLKSVPFSTVIAYEGAESFIYATNSSMSNPTSSLPAGYKAVELPEADRSLVNTLFKPQLPRMWE